MGQFLHLLTNSGIGLPSVYGCQQQKKIKPQFFDQIAAQVVLELLTINLSFFRRIFQNNG